MRSFNIKSLNAQLRYLEFGGEGIPLLMIHGLGCASSFEYPHVALAPALRGRRVILIDLLGFGFSDCPDAFGYSVQDHAERIAEFVREYCVGMIDLYGHSMGGSIVIETADLLGEQIRRLVISEANLDSGGGVFSRPIAQMSEYDYIDGGHRQAIDDALAKGNDAWAATMRVSSSKAVYRGAKSLVDGSSPDWRSRFVSYPARKTFIFGEMSLPDQETKFLSSRNIQVLIVPNAGHSMSVENPSGLATAIAQATA